jgi:hypothetical protein
MTANSHLSDQTCLCVEDVKTLDSILLNFPLHDRGQAFQILKCIRRQAHQYYDKWKTLNKSDCLNLVIDILRRYEANGLQLGGYGCWFFERLVLESHLMLDTSSKYSEDSIIELLLRMLLEHDCYTNCISILSASIKLSPPRFRSICDIGNIHPLCCFTILL